MKSVIKKTKDILGLNARSFLYTKPFNLKPARRIADNKLQTKLLFQKNDIPVVETYKVISSRKELNEFDFDSLPASFVLKPNMGFGGGGIKVIFGKKKNGNWITSDNREITQAQLRLHINDILEGSYSLTHAPDVAFFEQRIQIHPDLKLYSYKGIPDIRLIIFNKVPIMAMLRLPTRESQGKANMDLGGIGAGIDISRGITTHAVVKQKFFPDRAIDYVPGTRLSLRGIQIPEWNKILHIAIKASEISNLGYAGVDIAIDKNLGPVILEVNARPGLSIQNANLATLADRLRRVKGLQIKTAKKGITIAQELFGGEFEQELEDFSGKQILGIIEKIKLFGVDDKSVSVQAKIDTGAGSTSVDKELCIKLGYKDVIDFIESFGLFKVFTKKEVKELEAAGIEDKVLKHKDIKSAVMVHSSHGSTYRFRLEGKIKIKDTLITSHFTVMDRQHLQYPVIIGRKDLKRFLIDPTK